MFLKQIFLGACGLSFGLLASAGVFTVLVSVGLIPRFAGKFHVAKKVFFLEEAVVFGTLAGGFFSVFGRYGEIGKWMLIRQPFGADTSIIWQFVGSAFLCMFGLFAGIFVGCLALAIAEMLDSIPIFARRISFRHGIGLAIAATAAGKLIGSLIYFSREIYLSGM